ncbi:MAG: hypothetical protein ABR611_14830 [Chthoniobacterales bacterium]
MTSIRTRAWALGVSVIALSVSALVVGQKVERAHLAHVSSSRPIETPRAAGTPAPDYRQLAIEEMLAQPFSDFYEALRAAPTAARDTWAAQIASVPPGPRRTAAFRAFYKLLVQFDPAAAAEKVAAITDPHLQRSALHLLVDAAPESAVPLIAELVVRLKVPEEYPRDSFSEICREWSVLDPPALARFFDAHPKLESNYLYEVLIGDWAALDPEAAIDWLSKHEIGRPSGYTESPPREVRVASSLIEGWFLNDPAGATEYVINHADNPDFQNAIADLAAQFYAANRQQEVKAYFERLPSDAARRLMFEGLRDAGRFDSEDEMRTRHTDPRSMTEWITQYPAQYWQGTLGSRLEFWAQRDLNDLLGWLAQQPAPIRDVVAADVQIPHEISHEDFANRIFNLSDSALRDQLLRSLVSNQSLDFDEATAAVTNAPLSVEQKRHLLQIIVRVKAEKDRDYGSEK